MARPLLASYALWCLTACGQAPCLCLVSGEPQLKVAAGSNATAVLRGPCELDLDFGSGPVGQPLSATVELRNVGSSDFSLLTRSAPAVAAFDLTVVLPQKLAPKGKLDLPLTFVPPAGGALTDRLAFTTSSAQCPSVYLGLTGTGLPTACLTVDPPTLDFGPVTLLATSTQPLTFTNCSTVPIALERVALAGSEASLFAVQPLPSGPLAPGAVAAVELSYTPQALELVATAIVTFTTSATPPRSVNLAGTPAACTVTIAPDPLEFEPLAIGQSASSALVVTNTARTPVAIRGVAIVNPGLGALALGMPNPELPATLPPGATVLVPVIFAPHQIDLDVATVQVETGAGCNPTVDIGGIALPPDGGP